MKMTKEDFKNYFSSSFQGMDSILDVLSPIFGPFDKKAAPTNTDYVQKYGNGNANIEHIYDYGTYYTDNVDISVWEVILNDRCHISRSRQKIQDTIRSITLSYSGAFIVFHYSNYSTNPEASTWRLSWLKRQDVRRKDSPAKRYTYLCGPEYSCRTIAERFFDLQNSGNRTLDSITKVFDVEALSDEFFKEYKVIYDDIVQWITGKRIVKEGNKWVEFPKNGQVNIPDTTGIYQRFLAEFNNDDKEATKAVRDYVKKLMGRLVFIQFLQKKGCLKINEKSTTNFLLDLFTQISDKSRENFIDGPLENVVYLLLNNENRKKGADIIDNLKLTVPFLNGGLFEHDRCDNLDVKLPEEFFHNKQNSDDKREFGNTTLRPANRMLKQCGILDLFNHYNFTIDENDPDDAEMGVDPEMLGKIFENLLEDNKDKGAFYTPKEIVNYMCKESLIAYLCSKIKNCRDENIRKFVEDRDFCDVPADDVMKALKNVKICDPAVGSGAFPMGLLNLLVALREKLESSTQRVELKKEIIQNNIYGVDIEKGAIDIARLRFWLSIMVDEEVDENTPPTPLPNFDYKFMQGNSLLESFQGFDLSTIYTTSTSNGPVQLTLLNASSNQQSLHSLIDDYFNESDHKKKENLRKIINDEVKTLITNSIGTNPEMQATLDSIDVSANQEFFLWHTWFKDVFENGREGFDIVIGNPPYGANIDNLTTTYKKTYPQTSEGFKDIYKYFYDHGFSLLEPRGLLCFITPNTFLRQPRYGDLRRLILKNKIFQILDLGENVFDAVVPVAILIAQKKSGDTLLYVDLTKMSNVKTALSSIKFKKIAQKLYHSTQNNIFVEKIRTKKCNEISLESILSFKDAGINYQRVKVGLKEKGKSDLSSRLLYEGNQQDVSDVEYWKGEDINSYFIKDRTTRYCRRNIKLRTNERVILNDEYFSIAPKIIWRQTAQYPIVTIDYRGIWFGRSIQAGTIKVEFSSIISYEYLCGILNSKYIRFIYENDVKEAGRVYPQVKLEKLKPLPIVIPTSIQNQSIVRLVNNIFLTKQNTPQSDTISLEHKIDILVYLLYELSWDEVQNVENSFIQADESDNTDGNKKNGRKKAQSSPMPKLNINEATYTTWLERYQKDGALPNEDEMDESMASFAMPSAVSKTAGPSKVIVEYHEPYDSFGFNYIVRLEYDYDTDNLQYSIKGLTGSTKKLTPGEIKSIKEYLRNRQNIEDFFNNAKFTASDRRFTHARSHDMSMEYGDRSKSVSNGDLMPWAEPFAKLC